MSITKAGEYNNNEVVWTKNGADSTEIQIKCDSSCVVVSRVGGTRKKPATMLLFNLFFSPGINNRLFTTLQSGLH